MTRGKVGTDDGRMFRIVTQRTNFRTVASLFDIFLRCSRSTLCKRPSTKHLGRLHQAYFPLCAATLPSLTARAAHSSHLAHAHFCLIPQSRPNKISKLELGSPPHHKSRNLDVFFFVVPRFHLRPEQSGLTKSPTPIMSGETTVSSPAEEPSAAQLLLASAKAGSASGVDAALSRGAAVDACDEARDSCVAHVSLLLLFTPRLSHLLDVVCYTCSTITQRWFGRRFAATPPSFRSSSNEVPTFWQGAPTETRRCAARLATVGLTLRILFWNMKEPLTSQESSWRRPTVSCGAR